MVGKFAVNRKLFAAVGACVLGADTWELLADGTTLTRLFLALLADCWTLAWELSALGATLAWVFFAVPAGGVWTLTWELSAILAWTLARILLADGATLARV